MKKTMNLKDFDKNILNSSFKIPTWYGIDIKAGFDNSEGIYLKRISHLTLFRLSTIMPMSFAEKLSLINRMCTLQVLRIASIFPKPAPWFTMENRKEWFSH